MNYPNATPEAPGLALAIRRAKGPTALARALNLKGPAVVQAWRRTRVPSDHCPAIEKLTGVPCEQLRPDIEWAVLRRNAAAVLAADAVGQAEQA